MAELVMELTGCGPLEAAKALVEHKEIWLAVDALTKKPECKGDKYIPEKPKIETGMDAEQEERCKKGRWLQDQVNVVFSVAHSKTRTLQDATDPSASQVAALPSSVVAVEEQKTE